MAEREGLDLFRPDPDGMPPLATSIPDTAAVKILGEWVVSGNRTLKASILR